VSLRLGRALLYCCESYVLRVRKILVMVQVVIHRSITADIRVQSQTNSCEIYGGCCVAETVLSPSNSVSPKSNISPTLILVATTPH
jgi:hypothetical protein